MLKMSIRKDVFTKTIRNLLYTDDPLVQNWFIEKMWKGLLEESGNNNKTWQIISNWKYSTSLSYNNIYLTENFERDVFKITKSY